MSASSQSILTSSMMDTLWPNPLVDIGYAFTVSVEDCKNHLTKKTGRDLTALDIAKIISFMCRTVKNLTDLGINLSTASSFWSNGGVTGNELKDKTLSSAEHTIWKPEIFVQAVKEVQPAVNWKEVCIALDHSDFYIKDRSALILLMTIIRLGVQSSGAGQHFPPECLYRHWTNIEGQLSVISMILKNPDVYSFADHIFTSVSVELLKTPPETDNKEIAQWRSLHLVEVLLYIAENGYYASVLEHFKLPIQHCPDVLVMGLLQINPPLTVLRQEIFSTLIPIFLGNHPNSATILHHAWNSTNFNHSLKHIIMHSMSEWYLRGDNDQLRLTRILDVAQDLKALSSLLNVRSFLFVIDLACLASRREYLKLEKWLGDKIREHGEPFVQAMVKFLQRRCPQLLGAKMLDDQIPKVAQLPQETLSTMITCLQACIGNVQQDLNAIILTMVAHCNILLNKQRQQTALPPPTSILRAHRSLETPFSASAASISNQMFSGPSVDTISGLGTNMAGLSLSGQANGAFNFNNMLSSLGSTPASPSRLLQGQTNNAFPIVSLPSIPPMNNDGRMAPTPTGDKLNLTMSTNQPPFPEMPQNVSKEVEDEANSYFQRIYNHPPHPTLTIDEVLDMLQRFQESQSRKERDVAQCMLRNLFEEYRFFPQYPDKELQITAQLFGGMVERNLVTTYVALGLALRCVLDALRKPEGTKMYFFGVTALDRFKSKLHLYQKYCEHVRSITHFNEFPPVLIEYIEFGAQGQEPPNKLQGQMLPQMLPVVTGVVTPGSVFRANSATNSAPSTPNSKATTIATSTAISSRNLKSIANATNITTLLVANADYEEKLNIPPDTIQDKTAFIFNNLSQLNLQTKCDELKEIMTKDYWPWLAQYMVLKRASIELNFHTLYSNFLDALKNQDIVRFVTKETYRNIRVLLRSDKGIENFSDRSLLKNLGHWLGLMTLGRNTPILQIDLDLKSLLMEAYHKGQQDLLYVVPFIAKIVESCAKSKVFKPPNPWTMGIMNVLAELHQEPELKLNLKFEIEVLCKTLSIEVSELKPTIYLKDPDRLLTIEYQLKVTKEQVPQQPIITHQISDESNLVPSSTASTSPNQPGIETPIPTGPPEPRFQFNDIQPNNIASLAQHIVYSPNIAIIHTHPQLKQLVRTAIERSITDWLAPVTERSIRIATTTSEQIMRKDFALDPDENRMRTAAYYMVRNLTAGMALITCRDQLITSISGNIKTAFTTSLTPSQLPEPAEEIATQIAIDNVELACAFIQKSAIEKAIPEIEKRLTADLELRKFARQEGRRYCDPTVLTYQTSRMPEQIRLKVGGPTSGQFSVYDEFGRNIPGFQPLSERDSSLVIPKVTLLETTPVLPFNEVAQAAQAVQAAQAAQAVQAAQAAQAAQAVQAVQAAQAAQAAQVVQVAQVAQAAHGAIFGADDFGYLFEEVGNKMEAFLNTSVNIPALQIQVTNMHALLEYLLAARRQRDNLSALNLLNKSVEGIMEGLINIPEHNEQIKMYRDIHLRVLHLLHDARAFGAVWTRAAITKCAIECREEIRYNLEGIDALVSANFIIVTTYDQFLSQMMDSGNNYLATAFGMQLIQHFFIDDRPYPLITENDFFHTIDLLVRMSAHPRAPEGLSHLIDMLRLNHDPNAQVLDRVNSGPTQHIHSGILQVRANDYEDPPGLVEKAEYLLKDWVSIYHSQSVGRDPIKTFGMFVSKMNLYGILKTDDLITRFFRQATQLCIDLVHRNLNDPSASTTQTKTKIFQWIDAFVRLIALIIKHSGETGNSTTKINLLNKILGIIIGVLLQDQEQHGTGFQQLGYHRLFIMLFLELNAPEPILETISLSVVTAFCHTYHILRPSIAPGFCYSWLELISHRVFIGRIMALIPQQKGWTMYSQLLLDLFKYLAPFLRNAELAKPVQLLYKGTLRVLLVLLHDFPEFLCDYHFGFCDVIPSNCIQMRNLILAAFPRNMRLPDPFTPNLKVDMLNEIATAPRIFTNYVANIQPASFKKDLDSYLKQRTPVTFLSELRGHLQISNTAGLKYNVPLMNALILYVGNQAIAHIRAKNLVPNMTTIVHCSHMDIFQNLAVDLDHEGRYLFLNAIANQLRYPNSHTHYFSCALLYLFAEANSEAIQEQITRVLLERLIVNRPHPWGLLITFIELIKNPIYKFWDHDFVHCAPEIEKLFESVARSCMVVKSSSSSNAAIESDLQECN